MLVGLNVDPRFGFDPHDLYTAENWVSRSVLKPDHDMQPWIDSHAQLDMSVVSVVARESLLNWSEDWGVNDYINALVIYANLRVTCIQLGNESFTDGESSWKMEPCSVDHLIEAGRRVWPHAYIIGPGLYTAEETRQLRTLDLLDAVAVHYPQHRHTLTAFYKRFKKPVWVTEFLDIDKMASLLGSNPPHYLRGIIKYCWDSIMNPEHGIVDNGVPNEDYPKFMTLSQTYGSPL